MTMVKRLGLSQRGALLAVLLGFAAGVGGYTFYYAQGLSYFNNDPRTCVNCHIMRGQFDSWTKASHHGSATCVDCHLPQDFPWKYVAKSENGYHHSKAFTLQDFHEPIMIKPANARILQENCLRCHGEFVHQIVAGSTTDRRAVTCVHCHSSVGHGPLK
jgi:cytochrome c nitrite reductase small subunit